MNYEVEFWKSVVSGIGKSRVPILSYEPQQRQMPPRLLDVFSSWKGIESILADIISKWNVGTGRCLEFGVERGYSTSALAAFFDSVTGVDTFMGDKHTGLREDIYEATRERLYPFANVQVFRSSYQEWIAKDESFYDMIHVDIIHTYIDTFKCGLWSAQHSQCTIFHDTESFRPVKQAVTDIARETNKTFYNFKECYGLGILI